MAKCHRRNCRAYRICFLFFLHGTALAVHGDTSLNLADSQYPNTESSTIKENIAYNYSDNGTVCSGYCPHILFNTQLKEITAKITCRSDQYLDFSSQ